MGACPVCSQEVLATANFCMSCGASLVGEHDTTTELSPPVVAGPSDRAVVVIERGPNAGSSYVVGDSEVTVGRLSDSEILLDDISVSRLHVVIRAVGDRHHLHDSGSLNGTYVNGRRVDSAELVDGDEIQVGRYKLRYLRSSR